MILTDDEILKKIFKTMLILHVTNGLLPYQYEWTCYFCN